MSATVVSDRHAREAPELRRKEVVTPEGVPLVFTIGRAGDRAAAFMVDTLMWAVPSVLLLIVGGSDMVFGSGGFLFALCLLAIFLLRNGWFMFFELRWQGRTPGKRLLGLRVVDARGGVLEADQVVVRNLTREVETFLPLVVLANPGMLLEAGPGWVRALSVLWLALFLLLPLLNHDRRRVGDLLAGTIVIRDPRAALRRDLLARPASRDGAPQLAFTRAQLEMYGVYELQVLEDLLRNEPRGSEALEVVARKVRRKLGWRPPPGGVQPDPREFLEAFYRAQRSRLEQGLVLGQARERKRKGRLRGED